MKRFNKKVIWITGASSGIGEACAYAFAKEGAILILTALETDLLEKVKEKCIQLGATDTTTLTFDLSLTSELESLAHKALKCFGRIDILYNNAGISQRANAMETSMDVIRKIMEVNYFAPVILTKTLLPHMIKQGGGQLVVTTSIAGRFGFPLRSAYSSSKHALYGFFETVHAECYDQNIRVTLVCPGRVRTNISFYALEKDGTPHGKMDSGQASGITPQKAAKIIIKAVYHKKREVLVGSKELVMTYIKRFFPAIAAKLARNIKSM